MGGYRKYWFMRQADLEYETRHSDFCGPLEHSTLAAYYGRETSLSEASQETQKYYNAYAFQHSEESISDFKCKSSTFGLTLSVVLQIFKAVSYVHSIGFVVDLLDSPSTYVFKQFKDGVSVKLLPFRCFPEDSQFVGCHTKESNCRDFGLFLARFFFSSDVSIQEVLKYNPQLNEPAMRYTPVIAGKRLYSLEVIDLIEKLVATPLIECDPSASKVKENSVSPLRKVRNRPFSWSWEKRVFFRIISWEWLRGLPHGHPVIDEIDKMPDFLSAIGHEWCNLPPGVLKDLRSEKGPPKKRRRDKSVFQAFAHAARSQFRTSGSGGKLVSRASAHVARSKGRTSGSAGSRIAMKRSLRKALVCTYRQPRCGAAVKQQNKSGRGSASRNSVREKGDTGAPQPLVRGSTLRNSGCGKGDSKAPHPLSRGSASRNSGRGKGYSKAPQPLSRGSASRNSGREKSDSKAPQPLSRGSALRNSGHEKSDSKAPQLSSRGSASRNSEREKSDSKAPQLSSRGSASRNSEREKGDAKAPQPLSRGSDSRDSGHEKADPRAPPQQLRRGSDLRNSGREKADAKAPQQLGRGSDSKNSEHEKADPWATQPLSRGSTSRSSRHEKADPKAPHHLGRGSDSRNSGHEEADPRAPQPLSRGSTSMSSRHEKADPKAPQHLGRGSDSRNSGHEKADPRTPQHLGRGSASRISGCEKAEEGSINLSKKRKFEVADEVPINVSVSRTFHSRAAAAMDPKPSASRYSGREEANTSAPHISGRGSASRNSGCDEADIGTVNLSKKCRVEKADAVANQSVSRTCQSLAAAAMDPKPSGSRNSGLDESDGEAPVPVKKLTPVSFSAIEFLQKSRNFIVHGPLSEEVHGFDEYSRYNENIVRGFEMFLSAEFPSFSMHVYEVLSRAWSEGLCDKKCMECFLNPSYEEDQESDG